MIIPVERENFRVREEYIIDNPRVAIWPHGPDAPSPFGACRSMLLRDLPLLLPRQLVNQAERVAHL